MIRPLEPAANPKTEFVVADIENKPDGSVFAVDTAWREGGEIQHFLCTSWDEWWEWLFIKAKDDKRFRTIYAHNGGGWDWLSLAGYLLRSGRGKRKVITANLAASKMVTMGVKIDDGNKHSFIVRFCDSLQLLRSSLDVLGKKFCGRGKVDIGGKLPHEILEENPPLFWDYVKNDTELLLQVLERSLELIRDRVAGIESWGYTIGGTALKVFKTMGIAEPITIPFCPIVKKHLREGYRGGRVEILKPGYYEKIRVYDVNSLYPHAMLSSPVPVSDRGVWVDDLRIGEEYPCGVFDVSFEQKNRDVIPCLMVNGEGRYSGEGTYFTPELRLLRRVDPTARIDVRRGFVFSDCKRVFSEYVTRLYGLRLEDKDGPLSLLCKYLLNSLYGKFGQHSERETLVTCDSLDELCEMMSDDPDKCPRPISEEYGVFGVPVEIECGFEHVGIAGMITSTARETLYRGIEATGMRNVVYCDTDSVHTTGILSPEMVSDRLGDFKLEFEGEGAYAGKKLYALRDFKGKEKIRAKGISVGGKNGCKLSFDDLKRICEGEIIECKFWQPTTALRVFRGDIPCVFQPRKRKIRRIV